MSKHPNSLHQYFVLTPTEERIFRFLESQENEVSISAISRALGLARTSIYNAIYSLTKRNMVHKVRKYKYILVNKNLRPYKQKIVSPKMQIEMFMREMLQLNKGEVIYSIESDEEVKELFYNKAGLPKWQRAVAEKGIVLKGIGSTIALALAQSQLQVSKKLSKEIKKRSGSARFTDNAIHGPCVLISFKNSVVFLSRMKNFFYRIDDANVARFTQDIIDSLYNFLEYQPIVINHQ